jgi:hypothetical protein
MSVKPWRLWPSRLAAIEALICPHRVRPCTDCRLALVRRWPCLRAELTVLVAPQLRDRVAA